MKKRDFLKKSALVTAGIVAAPSLIASACATKMPKPTNQEPLFLTLPALPYSYDAFPDVIDALTMQLHYTKHHQGYVNKLNEALKQYSTQAHSLEELLRSKNLPEAIRNNGGGHFNHTLYWDILTPGGVMSPAFHTHIVNQFGSKEAFLNQLTVTAMKRFGSGWVWLCQDADKKLFITSTPNQDNSLMAGAEKPGHPLLGIDVWEHAYYLKYQNRRDDYLSKIIPIINWEKVESRML